MEKCLSLAVLSRKISNENPGTVPPDTISSPQRKEDLDNQSRNHAPYAPGNVVVKLQVPILSLVPKMRMQLK